MFQAPENWQSLSATEKLEARFAAWMAAEGTEFSSPEVAQTYKDTVQRLKDVIQLKKPDHIPICPNIGFYVAEYTGITGEDLMYDYEKLGAAWKKFHTDFKFDTSMGSFLPGPGPLFERLDYKLYRWPGHGTPPETSYQCVEAEYMLPEEYDSFIADPSGYFMRSYLPRIFGAFQPWQMLSPLTDILELPFVGTYFVPVGLPDMQQAFQAYLEAGQMALEWISEVGKIDSDIIATLGQPPLMGGISKAPFDTLGDTLRGTRGIMLDMYRRPDKLLRALDQLVPLAIEMGVRVATVNNHPIVFIPLHKGADGFMSNTDFEKFYWPTLKAVILGLVEEGLVPYLFVEGGYNQRLDIITDADIPAGTTLWIFDQTEISEVKKRFSGWACFGGNVPASLLKAGTPDQMENYVKNLIDTVGQDGGYVLSNGAVLDNAQAENLHAMINAGREYGVY